MVVEGIGVHVEDILVSLVLSLNISWTFMILAHDEDQYSQVYKILEFGNSFSWKLSVTFLSVRYNEDIKYII